MRFSFTSLPAEILLLLLAALPLLADARHLDRAVVNNTTATASSGNTKTPASTSSRGLGSLALAGLGASNASASSSLASQRKATGATRSTSVTGATGATRVTGATGAGTGARRTSAHYGTASSSLDAAACNSARDLYSQWVSGRWTTFTEVVTVTNTGDPMTGYDTETFTYGTADVYTTIDGVPHAHGTLTPTSTSVKSGPFTWTYSSEYSYNSSGVAFNTAYPNTTSYASAETCYIDQPGCKKLWSSFRSGHGLGPNATIASTVTGTPHCVIETPSTLAPGECDYPMFSRSCEIKGNNVQLYYWPSATAAPNATLAQSVVTRINNSTMTFVSPSVYLAFDTISAYSVSMGNGKCGSEFQAWVTTLEIGKTHTSSIVPLDPTGVSSQMRNLGPGVDTSSVVDQIMNNGPNYQEMIISVGAIVAPTVRRVDFDHLVQPAPTDYYLMGWNSLHDATPTGCSFLGPQPACSTIFDDWYKPVIGLPQEVEDIDPKWSSCGLYWLGVYDPPIAIQQTTLASIELPTTTAAQSAPPTTPASPNSLPASPTAQPTTTASADPDRVTSDPPQVPGGSTADPAQTGSPPSTQDGQPDQSPQSAGGSNTPDPYPPSDPSETIAGGGDGAASDVPAAVSNTQAASPSNAVSVLAHASAAEQTAAPPANTPYPTPDDPGASSAQPAADPRQSSAAAPAAPATEPASDPIQTTANASPGEPASNADPYPQTGQDSPPGTAAAPLVLTISADSTNAVAGGDPATQTGNVGTPGQGSLVPVIVSNAQTTFTTGAIVQSAGPGSSEVVIGGTTQAIVGGGEGGGGSASVQIVQTIAPAISIGQSAVSVDASSDLVFGTQTLHPGGSAITVDGTSLSLASSGSFLVVDGSTSSLPAPVVQTMTAGVAVAPQQSSPALLTVSPIASTTGAVEIGGQTLSIGGSALTTNGQTISLGSAGVVVQSSGGVTTQMLPPSPTDGAVLTVGSTIVTASPVAGTGAAVAIGDTTLALGGAALTTDGETISLGSAGIVVQSSGGAGPQTIPLSHDDGAVLTVGSMTITASEVGGTSGAVVVGDTTLSIGGSALTTSGEVISLASGGLVLHDTDGVATSTVGFSPVDEGVITAGSATITALAVPGSSGVVAIGDTSISVGGSALTTDGEVISLAPGGSLVVHSTDGSGLSTIGLAPLDEAVITAGSATLTATAVPGSSGVVEIGGTTLSSGGSALTTNGEVISVGPGGSLVVHPTDGAWTSTIGLSPVSEGIIDAGSATLTAFEVPGASGEVVIGSTTLSIGGAALTTDGETISLASGGLVVVSSGQDGTTTVPLSAISPNRITATNSLPSETAGGTASGSSTTTTGAAATNSLNKCFFAALSGILMALFLQ